MAGNKYLSNSNGVLQEVISSQTSAGAGDAGKIPALNSNGVLDTTIVNSTVTSAGAGSSGKLPALDASGHLDPSVLPTGIAPDVVTITASEALAAGAFVNIWTSTGTKVRNADQTSSSKRAHGFVLAAVSSGASASVYLSGLNTAVSSQTVGDVFLGSTGAATSTAPTTSTNIVQNIGVAVSATAIQFDPQTPIILA